MFFEIAEIIKSCDKFIFDEGVDPITGEVLMDEAAMASVEEEIMADIEAESEYDSNKKGVDELWKEFVLKHQDDWATVLLAMCEDQPQGLGQRVALIKERRDWLEANIRLTPCLAELKFRYAWDDLVKAIEFLKGVSEASEHLMAYSIGPTRQDNSRQLRSRTLVRLLWHWDVLDKLVKTAHSAPYVCRLAEYYYRVEGAKPDPKTIASRVEAWEAFGSSARKKDAERFMKLGLRGRRPNLHYEIVDERGRRQNSREAFWWRVRELETVPDEALDDQAERWHTGMWALALGDDSLRQEDEIIPYVREVVHMVRQMPPAQARRMVCTTTYKHRGEERDVDERLLRDMGVMYHRLNPASAKALLGKRIRCWFNSHEKVVKAFVAMQPREALPEPDERLQQVELPAPLEWRLPRHSRDLIEVGKKLGICVGAYTKLIKEGSCGAISFIYEAGLPKYCLETDLPSRSVKQFEGYCHSNPDPDDERVVLEALRRADLID